MVAQTYIVVGNKACERLKLGEHGWGLDRSPARHCVESRDELTTIANWRDRSGARTKQWRCHKPQPRVPATGADLTLWSTTSAVEMVAMCFGEHNSNEPPRPLARPMARHAARATMRHGATWRGHQQRSTTTAATKHRPLVIALYRWCLSNIAVCYMQVPLQSVSNSGSLFALYR